jgi:hypothetical protein
VVENVLIAAGVLSLLLMLATAAAAVFVVRRVRRRFRAARARLLASRASQRDLHGLLRGSTSAAVASMGSPGWWVIQNRRHRMWRAVSSAEHAVGVARRADVAVGELPGLARRLSNAAAGVDAVLRASDRGGSLGEQDRMDCDRIVAAASDVRAAALSSLRSTSHADTDTITSAVQIEVAALAAGVRAARG